MKNINTIVVIAILLIAATFASCERGKRVDQAQSQSNPQVQAHPVPAVMPQSLVAPKVYSNEEARHDGMSNDDAATRVLGIRDSNQQRAWRINCAYSVGAGLQHKQPTDDQAIDYCTWIRDLYCKNERRNEPRCTKQPSWEIRRSIEAK